MSWISMSKVCSISERYFFFSSRRRHTRFKCDWSSDVCSSDLKQKTAYEFKCDWSSDVCSSDRSEEHTSELQSHLNLVCRLLLGTARHAGASGSGFSTDRKSVV